MCIPIFFVCGEQASFSRSLFVCCFCCSHPTHHWPPAIPAAAEQERVKALGQARFCSNCGTKDGAQLFESYGRFHFCFVPLCKVRRGPYGLRANTTPQAERCRQRCPSSKAHHPSCLPAHAVPPQTGERRTFYRCGGCGAMYPS